MIGDETFIPCSVCRGEVERLRAQVHELTIENERLGKIAYFDYLTGIPSRSAFENEILRCMGRYKRRPLSIAFIDLDNFKSINDRYGHSGGDTVLKLFVEIVTDACRPNDFFARVGGEEFVIIFHDMKRRTAIATTRRIRHAIETKLRMYMFPIDGEYVAEQVCVTASFGVGQWKSRESHNSLVHRVNIGLHKSKSDGKNRVTAV